MVEPVLPDSDAMIWSAPEHKRSGRPLLVLLHGHGGVAEDMTTFFSALPVEVVAVSVRGPVEHGTRWTWWDYQRQPEKDFDAAAAGLLTWLDTLPVHPSVGVGGFSQGGVMALQLLRHRPRRFQYALQLNGFVREHPLSGDTELAAVRPPVLSINGGRDDVIPVHFVERTADWLGRHTDVTRLERPDLGHEITDQTVADVGGYVGARLRPSR